MMGNHSPSTRRSLHFDSIDDLFQELDRIVEAEQAGRLKPTGNWTTGEILSHVAAWIEYGYVGYPVKSPPWFIKPILRLMLKKYLKNGMPSGVRIPGIKEGTVGMDDIPFDVGIARLRKAFERLKAGEESPFDSPAFGKMSHQDRIRLNLRHAELHLGHLAI